MTVTVETGGGTFLWDNFNNLLQDKDGFYYAIFRETEGGNVKLVIKSSRDAFASKVYLVSPVGGDGAFLETASGRTVTAAYDSLNERIFVYYDTAGHLGNFYVSILADIPNWNVAASWVQNDEVTQGSSSSGNPVVLSNDTWCDVDELGNFYPFFQDFGVKIYGGIRNAGTMAWTFGTVYAADQRFEDYFVQNAGGGFLEAMRRDLATANLGQQKTSTNPRDPTAWGAETQVADVGGVDCQSSMGEFMAGEIVTVGHQSGGASVKWNHFDGAVWTEGIAGTTTGLPQFDGAIGAAAGNKFVRDGAGNAYYATIKSDGVYAIYKFDPSVPTWIELATYAVGAGDAFFEGISTTRRVHPTRTKTAALYVDLTFAGNQALLLDEFDIQSSFTPTPEVIPCTIFDSINADFVEYQFENVGGDTGKYSVEGSVDQVNWEVLKPMTALAVGAEAVVRLTRDQTCPRYFRAVVEQTIPAGTAIFVTQIHAKGRDSDPDLDEGGVETIYRGVDGIALRVERNGALIVATEECGAFEPTGA